MCLNVGALMLRIRFWGIILLFIIRKPYMGVSENKGLGLQVYRV